MTVLGLGSSLLVIINNNNNNPPYCSAGLSCHRQFIGIVGNSVVFLVLHKTIDEIIIRAYLASVCMQAFERFR